MGMVEISAKVIFIVFAFFIFGITAYPSQNSNAFVNNEAASTLIGANDTSSLLNTQIGSARGIAFDSSGNIWVADTGNNRIMEFPKGSGFTSLSDGKAAIVVLGQPNLASDISGNGGTSANSLSAPSALTFDSSGNLWVADLNENRVLEYQSPFSTGESATVVLGQNDLTSYSANQDSTVSATGLSGPSGLAFDSSGNLWVADHANNRIVMFPKGSGFTSSSDGEAATVVLGQSDFTSNSADEGSSVSANGLDFPQGLTFDSSGNLWVADSNNHRVIMFPKGSGFTSSSDGEAATVVLGQPDFTHNIVDETGSVSATGLDFPNGITFDSSGNLWAADIGNSRVIMFPKGSGFTSSSDGEAATVVLGQNDFVHDLTNEGSFVSANGLANPYGLAFDSSGNLWVADTINSRVIMFPKGSGFTSSSDGEAATVVLGQASLQTFSLSKSLLGPEYNTFDSSGNLWVADQINNRVLEYVSPFSTGEAATVVLGQSDFTSNSADQGSSVSANGLDGPTGLAFDSSGNLWVTDTGNNRILEFQKGSGFTTGEAATVVLGQSDFTSNSADQSSSVSANGLDGPTGLAFDSSGNLWAADIGNSRVIMFPKGSGFTSSSDGEAATVVLGQNDFTSFLRNENGGSTANANGLDVPNNIAFDSTGNIWVADLDNHRVIMFPKGSGFTSSSDGEAATVVLGQNDLIHNAANQGSSVSANTLDEPFSLAFDSTGNLWVADGANSRIVMFPKGSGFTSSSDGEAATVVLGQNDLTHGSPNKGDSSASSSGLNFPESLAFDSTGNLWVADSNNNRVVMFPKGSGFTSSSNGEAATVLLGDQSSFQSGIFVNGKHLSCPTSSIFDSSGNLWVADACNNRVLEFLKGSGFTSSSNGEAATVVLGQPDSTSNFPNQGGIVSTNTLSNPLSLAFDSSGNLWVADAGNNRILEFPKGSGFTTNEASTVVLGQSDFTLNSIDEGDPVSANGLDFPQGIAFDSSGNLWVTDEDNNRILEFPKGSGFTTNEASTVVLGQSDFTSHSADEGGSVSANGLDLPQNLAFDSSGNLWVADSNNHRIVMFPKGSGFTSSSDGETATVVLGQSDFTSHSADEGGSVSANGLDLPQNLAFDSSGNLWVTDSNNHRVLQFFKGSGFTSSSDGEASTVVLGQPDFTSNSANEGNAASANGFDDPYAISFDSLGNLWIGDQNNNIVLEFPNLSSLTTIGTNNVVSGSNNIQLEDFTATFTESGSWDSSAVNFNIQFTTGFPYAPSGTPIGDFYDVNTNSPDILSSRTITIAYNPSSLGSINPSTLQISRFSNGVWTALSSTVDTVHDTVTATAPGFSTFVITSTTQLPTASLGILYGTNAHFAQLLTISTITGAGTIVGNITAGSIPALAIDPTTNVMYAGQGGGSPFLYRVDPSAGNATLIGDTGLGFAGISGLAFSSDGTLFASVNIAGDGGTGSDHLAIIDKNSGIARIIGPYGTCTGVAVPSTGGGSCTIEGMEGITFGPDGILYGVTTTHGSGNPPALYSIDTHNGTATKIVTISNSGVSPSGGIAGLVFIGNTLYGGTATAVHPATDGGELITINPSTGAYVVVGHTTSGTSLSGLAIDPTLSESLSLSDQVTAGIKPKLTSIVAAGNSGTTFFSGNTITMHFSQPTNQKFGGSQNSMTATNFNSLFTCSSSLGSTCAANLGTDFTGTWLDPSTLVITAGANGGPVSLSNNLVMAPIANSGLTNAAASAQMSTTSSPVLSGSFSSPPIPFITAFVANDPANGVTTFHAGDTLLIRFSEPTNEPGGTGTVNQAEIANIFSFTPSLGSSTYSGKWVNPSLFNITMNTVDNSNPAVIGTTTVSVIGIGSNSLTSNTTPPSSASSSTSPPLSGSFGTFAVSIPVAAGGTAVATLPSGVIAQTTIGSSTAQTVTYTKTTAPTTAPAGSSGSTLQFLGTPVDISLQEGACSTGAECTFSFEFTCDDVNTANENLPSSQQITFTNGIPNVSIFHDRQHDQTFSDSGDQLPTQVTQLSSCLFLATAQDDHTSKFAVGGVIAALAILGASENNAPAPPTLSGPEFSSDEYPVTINGQGLKLDGYTNTVTTSTFQVGKPVDLKLLLYSNLGPNDIVGASLFTNLHGNDLQVSDSNTILVYSDDATTITDPDGFTKSVNISAKPVNDKLQIEFVITFASPMDTSNLIIRTWTKENYKEDTQVINAFRVINPVSIQKSNSTLSDLISTNPVQLDVEKTLDPTSPTSIPIWVKSNAKWWADGKINDKNFLVGIQYMIQNDIITMPQGHYTDIKSETIPAWVKNDAGFWSDGSISDIEFAKGMQYLINTGIIRPVGNTSHLGVDPPPFR